MARLKRLADLPRTPYGLECRILRRLPVSLLGVTVVPLLLVLFTHWSPPAGPAQAAAKQARFVEIMAWSLASAGWAVILTLAIGCAIVWVMKGPGYVVDAYPLSDADQPAEHPNRDFTTPET